MTASKLAAVPTLKRPSRTAPALLAGRFALFTWREGENIPSPMEKPDAVMRVDMGVVDLVQGDDVTMLPKVD